MTIHEKCQCACGCRRILLRAVGGIFRKCEHCQRLNHKRTPVVKK